MKRTIVYDCPDEQGRAIEAYMRTRAENSGDCSFHDLGQARMEACTGCFGCWQKTPGECIFQDDAARLVAEIVNSDAVLLVCPVNWGGCSPPMKILLDRSICRVLPFFKTYKGETHHPPRYENSPVTFMAGYGAYLDPEEKELFHHIAESVDDNLNGTQERALLIETPEDFESLDRFFLSGGPL